MKPLTKKSKQAIGATVGISAAGITAYLIYKYLTKKKDDEFEPEPSEEPFVIPEIPISLENIMLIIQDVTLTQMEKIAILEAMYNEQFLTMEFQQTEVVQIESELQIVDEQIAQVLIDVVPYETQVAAKLSELTIAQNAEAHTYNVYINFNNHLNYLLNELAEAEAAHDNCFFLDLACLLRWALRIENRQRNVNVQAAITSNAWNQYLDKEQLRKEAENEYNSAILALELFKEDNLFGLQEEKIVLTNSLNMWKIAYQAANNILAELITQLEILGVSV